MGHFRRWRTPAREVDERLDILKSFVACFTDHRDPEAIEFSVLELLRQRVMGLVLGYEDAGDHDRLRNDRLMALLAGRRDVTGQDRRDVQDRGQPLAGKSTLNRPELTPIGADADSRSKKIVAHIAGLQDALVDVFIRLKAKQEVPQELVIDFDATDDPRLAFSANAPNTVWRLARQVLSWIRLVLQRPFNWSSA